MIPELPEVETIVRELRPQIMGKTVSGLILRHKAVTHLINTNAKILYQGLVSQTITTVLRKGKYIIFPLSNNNVLILHLGMTGNLFLQKALGLDLVDQLERVDKHTHILIELTDLSEDEEDLELHFNDVRLFGNLWLLEDVEDIEKLDVPGLKDLGPDALNITLCQFEDIMRSKRAVKAILLNQAKIAGVGNIYADEACFCAGVHPARKGVSLSEEQFGKLWLAVKTVLKQGIRYRGSSTSDYITTDGSKGNYQQYHRVYQKTGEECVQCGTPIERIKLAGRSTHFCPTCQKEGE